MYIIESSWKNLKIHNFFFNSKLTIYNRAKRLWEKGVCSLKFIPKDEIKHKSNIARRRLEGEGIDENGNKIKVCGCTIDTDMKVGKTVKEYVDDHRERLTYTG